MNKKLLEENKKRLEQEKKNLEQELSKFAKKDAKLKGDWNTQFPDIGLETTDDSGEEVARRREEYERLLPVEYALEKRLKNIEKALEKIKKGEYGTCQKCGQKISQERLKALPEAEFCRDCSGQ